MNSEKPNPVLKGGKVLSPEQEYISAIANLGGAITALVERMSGIEEKLDAIAGELSVLSMYTEKKGVQEGLLGPEDIEHPDNDAGEEPDEAKP